MPGPAAPYGANQARGMKMTNFPQRKSTRLKSYDYGTPGAYFITICIQDRHCILSEIVGEGLGPPAVRLMPYGQTANEQIASLPRKFPSIRIEKYVIMPNHIHFILRLCGVNRTAGGAASTGGASPAPTVIDVVRMFKSNTTRLCGTGPGLFQRSFHDHIIRDEQDYRRIWEYIDTNPSHWEEDCFYMMPGEVVGKGLGPPVRR